MNFEFSDEQRQLHDTVDRYLAEQYSFDKFRAINASRRGLGQGRVGADSAELGVLALNVPDGAGRPGIRPAGNLAVMGACGRSLLLEPYLSSAVIATAALRAFADDAAAAELLDAHGRRARRSRCSRISRRDSRFETQWVDTRAAQIAAIPTGSMGTRRWSCTPAPPTRCWSRRALRGARRRRRVSRCFGCPRDAPGLKLDVYPTIDGQRAADVYLQGVEVPAASRLGAEGGALPVIEAALDIGLAALCAEAVGVDAGAGRCHRRATCSRASNSASPIGRFQALQHRIADMLIHLEQARSMSYLAALRCIDENVARTAPRPVGGQGRGRPGRAASSDSRRCNCTAAWA